MNIVQLTQRFYYGRGQEVHVYNLSNELAKLGHTITIYTSDLDASDIFRKELHLHHRVKIITTKGITLQYPPNQIVFPNLAQELLQRQKVDLIHAHGAMAYSSLVGATVAKTLKIPFIYTPHFHPWRFFEQRPYRYTREAYELMFTVPIIKHSTKMIAVSPFEKAYLTQRRNISQHKIKVIANGINTFYYPSVVSRRAVRHRYHIPEGKKYIITFGTSTDMRKGLDRALRIFEIVNKQIPDTHLIIAGWKYHANQDYLARILDSMKSRKNVSTVGYVSEEDKVAFIKMSSVLVSPTSYEAFGIVLGEAMQLSVPVVVTRVGGTPFIVRHGKTGFTVGSYDSIRKFAEYTVDLIKDRELRRTMGEEGKRVVRTYFTWKKIAKQVNKLYEQVLREE